MKNKTLIQSLLMLFFYLSYWETYAIRTNSFNYQYKILCAFVVVVISLITSFALRKFKLNSWYSTLTYHILATSITFALFQGFMEDFMRTKDLKELAFSALIGPIHYMITPMLITPLKSILVVFTLIGLLAIVDFKDKNLQS